MAGLHRAIILRAMSILRARAACDQFTFTGGVAKNEAAVKALKELVRGNYGERRSTSTRLDLHRRARRRRPSRGARWSRKARRRRRTWAQAMIHTIGIDIGSGAVKSSSSATRRRHGEWLAKRCERIRRRDPMTLARQARRRARRRRARRNDAVYIATTGEGENVSSRPALLLDDDARAGRRVPASGVRAVVDIGALNGRAIYVDERGKVLSVQDDEPVRVRAPASSSRTSRATSAWRSKRSAGCRRARRNPGEGGAPSAPCSPRPTSSTWCQPRHRHARHPEGHPPLDGPAHRQAAQGHRHQRKARR